MPPDATDPSTTVQNANPGGEKPGEQIDINAIVNAAVSSQLKRALPKVLAETLGPAINAALEPALKPLQESLAALPKPGTEPAPDAKAKVKGKVDADEPDPKVVALEQKIAKLELDNKAAKESAARERQAARESKAFSDLRQELTGKVRPEALDAVSTLLRARNQVVIDDAGNVSLKLRCSLEKGLPEEDVELPLAEAIPHFIKTKEAALFVPPPNQGGAGPKGRSAPVPRTGGPQPQRVAMPGAVPSAIEAFEAEHGAIEDHL